MGQLCSDVRCTCYISTYTIRNYQLTYKISNGHAFFSDSVPAPPVYRAVCMRACVYVCMHLYMCVCVCTCTTRVQKSRAQGLVTTKLFKMVPNVFGYSEFYLLDVTFQAPRILSLRWSLKFWKICALLVYDICIFYICVHSFVHVNMCIFISYIVLLKLSRSKS